MDQYLPLFFVGVIGFSLLTYIILDGYDLGVGLLLSFAEDDEKDQMIASIGPFWDANETWIVFGVGVLLIAFPAAYGLVLTTLYIPATMMLIGLILRGVSFDFRAKAQTQHKVMWNRLFALGSVVAASSQGWMLGAYVMGLESTALRNTFAFGIAVTLPALYVMLGCAWLLMKASGSLYEKAIKWARWTVWPMGVGIFLISIATPMVSDIIADKWFTLPAAIGLLPIPISTLLAYAVIIWVLWHESLLEQGFAWLIFAGLVVICLMSALGLAYSIYPDIVINKMTIWDTAASTASLRFTFWGVALTLPMILIYTVFIYKIFSGKATKLSYE
ncbi:MAG: cytochrome d ubiquinol oxidase subunit II [Gammaproteobacteria bacterium]